MSQTGNPPGRLFAKELCRALIMLAPLMLSACKQPLQIQGQGDILEIFRGERGCSLEEYATQKSRCTDNEVFQDEEVAYRGLPRPGWRFSHWVGFCKPDSLGDDCEIDYSEAQANFWDSRDGAPLPLRAVFVQDGDILDGQRYIASNLGAVGRNSFASLLDALFTAEGEYRYTTLRNSTRDTFDRNLYNYNRQSDSLLATRPDGGVFVSGGAATKGLDFITLVDTDTSDDELSVAYHMPMQTEGANELFRGTYYCGHISTRVSNRIGGYSRFFRAVMDGTGRGALELISDRWGQAGTAGMTYEVAANGATTVNYLGQQLTGSLSADGSVFTAAEIDSNGKGAAICIQASANKTLGTVQGQYYGAWFNLRPFAAVTDILVPVNGQTAESVLRDSLGGRQYFFDQNFMLVLFDGRLETQNAFGAVSRDNRIMFLIDTNTSNFPRLAVYIKKGL